MARSAVSIANDALSRIGINAPIEQLEEDSPEARACRRWYDEKRKECLEATRDGWSFATRRATLVEKVETRSDWEHVYALPPKCLKPIAVVPEGAGRAALPKDRPAWKMEAAEDGLSRVLLTDQADAELVYTVDLANPDLFSALFASALAWRLAAELALTLKSDMQLEGTCLARFDYDLRRAAAADQNQGHPDPDPTSSFEEARR